VGLWLGFAVLLSCLNFKLGQVMFSDVFLYEAACRRQELADINNLAETGRLQAASYPELFIYYE